MKVTINTLKKLINEEFKKNKIQETKEKDRKNVPDMDEERQLEIAKALDVLEQAAEEAEDAEEVKWWLTKVGDAFGLEPEEED